jgi:adenylate kinase
MRIIITGSPGTGKSSIAKMLSKRLGLELLDLKRIAIRKKLVGKNHEVDIGRLAKAMRPLVRKNDFIVEGHLACEFRIPADFVFVLRTHPSVLKKRLSKRRYGGKKLDENLMSEMLDYCVVRAQAEYKNPPIELDTSRRSIAECASEIEKAIKRKKKKLDSVDYSDELKKQLKLR